MGLGHTVLGFGTLQRLPGLWEAEVKRWELAILHLPLFLADIYELLLIFSHCFFIFQQSSAAWIKSSSKGMSQSPEMEQCHARGERRGFVAEKQHHCACGCISAFYNKKSGDGPWECVFGRWRILKASALLLGKQPNLSSNNLFYVKEGF